MPRTVPEQIPLGPYKLSVQPATFLWIFFKKKKKIYDMFANFVEATGTKLKDKLFFLPVLCMLREQLVVERCQLVSRELYD